MLGDIWGAISSIPNKIQELITSLISLLDYLNPFSNNFILKGLLDYLNPLSDNFILKGLLLFIGNILDYLNPFSDNFILKGLLTFIGTILDYLNPFSDNFIFKDVFTFLADFFASLGEFLYNLLLPTEEQWEDISVDYERMGDIIKNHLPFVSFFNEQLRLADDTVSQTDFLVITIPSFSYSGSGGISVNSGEQRVINVGQAYEPYRAYIRGFLFLIVVGLACVYLVKYILNYGDVSSVVSGVVKNSKGGGE